MMVRASLMLLVATGACWGKVETAVTARLKADLQQAHPYVALAAAGQDPVAGGEPVLQLEPMTVTGEHSFEVDILAEARRVAEMRKAKEFSLLRGGTLLSFTRGELGFWPKLVPVDDLPVRKGTVLMAVDFLRIKW